MKLKEFQKNGLIFVIKPFILLKLEIPYDFGRFTSYGIKKLFLENNFKILKTKKLVTQNNASLGAFESQLNRLFNILKK
jgi:hypothetical protein